ncbi:TPA: LysR family transcriptional regulator [Pseudomonas aeruginosa]|nr:LysR family transcriptional regulator [Pseudomonas aeruginosa]HEH8432076.1 LysR family transcriptional regulator [Pseudomonas aeruginosa]HEH8533627.1 LysR family transcriptional regulator [Pseudomonas aeruginosa]HEH8759654.1 LysR family transcriptional regulator [Pseudomonas aeruginosa]
MDKLSAMRTFCSVIDSGSFSRAADALGLPKARVSQRISDLESDLGVRLLQRTTRAMNLTVDGAAYAERCRQILDDVDELDARMRGTVSSPQGHIRVEALTSISRWVLAPRLNEFRTRYPLIQLRLGIHDRVRNLVEDGIDCAIRGGHLEDSSLIARHVVDVAFGLYASPDYLHRFGTLNEPAVLERANLLGWFNSDSNTAKAWHLYSAGAEYCLKNLPSLVFDDPESAVAAAIQGAGITLAPPFIVEQHVKQRKLIPILPAWQFQTQPIHIVYPTSRHLSARVRAFVEWANEVMSNDAKLHLSTMDLATMD